MADPFDVTNSDIQPAGGGVSPDFYRNLLSFGLATMSAASQPGAQFLGSLGKGGLAAMESSRSNNQARIQNQLSQQSLLSNKIDMATKLNNLNWLRQQQGLPPIDSTGQIQSIQANAPQVGEANAPSSIAEPGSSAGASWSPSAGSSAPNQPTSVPAGPTPSAQGSTIGGVPTAIYSKMTPEEQQLAMLGQGYTLHGVPEMGKKYTELAYARFEARAKAEGEEDSKVRVSRAGIHELKGGANMPSSALVGPYKNEPAYVLGEGAQTAQVQPGQVIPDTMTGKPMAVGTHYRLPPSVNQPPQANGAQEVPQAMPQAPAGNNFSGSAIAPNNSPGVGVAAFQAATQAGAPEGAQPEITVGQQGMQANVPPPSPMGPNSPPPSPQQIASAMPQQLAPQMQAPQPPQAPQASTAGAVATELPPQQEELLKGATKQWIDKQIPLYQNAVTALGSAKVIDTDIQNLPRTGMLSTGATAKSRLDFVQKWNDVQRAAGVSDPNLLFDPSQAASMESLNKEALRLGFADARTLGAKEAASVVDQSIKANPGMQSSPIGIRLLNSTMAEKMQYKKDLIEYQHEQLTQHGVDTIKSEIEFNKQFPLSAYIQRGMSQIAPIPIAPSRPGALNGLLPGTRIRLANEPPTARGKVVPLTPDYKFSLPPTVHSLEQQGGE